MKLIGRIVDFFLYTSLFIACCAVGLCMATEQLINTHMPPLISPLHSLVFGSTLLVYNAKYIVRRKKNYPSQFRAPGTLLFSLGLALATSSMYFLPPAIIICSAILGALSFTYSWPLLPLHGKKRLREFGGIKILVLTGVWTIATSVLPMLYWQKSINDYPFEILQRFVFIFPLCIVFDIRDVNTDLQQKIGTLPQKLGLKNCYRLINGALISFVLLSLYQSMLHPASGRFTAAIITASLTWLIVHYLRKHPSDRAYLGLVDGAMLIYTLAVVSLI